MQDRFKFRFWSIKDKQFIDWKCYMQTACNRGCVENPYGMLYSLWANSRDFIPQQCTGLKDKNGKLIYEGDVVQLYNNNYKVIFDNRTAYFGIKVSNVETYTLANIDTQPNRIEVIGNIYDNPELLEGEQ